MIDREKCVEMANVIEKTMTDERNNCIISDEDFRKLSHIRSFLIGIGNYISDNPPRQREVNIYVKE